MSRPGSGWRVCYVLLLCQQPALLRWQRRRASNRPGWRERSSLHRSFLRRGKSWSGPWQRPFLWRLCLGCIEVNRLWIGCAGVAVPSVTSMRTLKGRMMSIPIRQGGDSSPTMIIKLALPRASPHWMSRCLVLPAMWSGLPCAPCTALVNGSRAPHWAR